MSTREEVIKKYTSGSFVSKDHVPGVIGLPTPGSSGLSTMTSFPSFSSFPSFPSMPSMPSIPSMPSMASIPAFGTLYGSYGSYTQPEGGSSYMMQVFFYLLLYTFIIFVICVFIHYTITPVFSFTPGDKGIIQVPGVANDSVYWNMSVQPDPTIDVPLANDSLASYPFTNSFSFCIDLYLTNVTKASVAGNRLILYKGARRTTLPPTPPTGTTMVDYMASSTVNASMIMYLANDTNDLVVTFFSADNTGKLIQYSCSPVKNLPLYTPFRISVIVEKNSFSVYLNGKQVFQKIVPGVTGIILNPNDTTGNSQRFYCAPPWANSPSQSIYVQNLHIWSNPITYNQMQAAQPTLASIANFGKISD